MKYSHILVKINNSENFCRSILNTNLIIKDKKQFYHKYILLIRYFDIKRFITSDITLIDGTF